MSMRDYFLFFFLILTGCQSVSTSQTLSQAEAAHFLQQRYTTSTFVLTAYERFQLDPKPSLHAIHVYIEGDGNSWKNKYTLSDNPTPKQPIAVQLALQDPHHQVIYLARPCQYTPLGLDPLCTPLYWSSHRYAPEVIQAFTEALDQIKQKTNATHFVLIGFSGGASVATLLAAQRKDITQLITVAGDLDHAALTRHHHTTPLTGSLNPITVAPSLARLPQYHWAGKRDQIVPSWMVTHFADHVGPSPYVRTTQLSGINHHGWKAQWPRLLQISLAAFP